MSVYAGPEMVYQGLVLCLDAANPKSYPGSGTSWNNLSGEQLVGELVNSPTYNTANNGYFQFQFATSTYARIPNSTALDTQSFTVEVWVKTNGLNQNGFWFEKGTVNTQYSLFQQTTSIICRVNTGSIVDPITLATSTYMNTTNWYQVAFTFTSGSQACYINGTSVATNTISGTLATNNGGMSIGAYGGYSGSRGYYYDGNLSVCRVYNRVLSPAEVAQNFYSLRGRYGV